MECHLYDTWCYQIEVLPRITIIFKGDWLIAFEWLFWSFVIQKSVEVNNAIRQERRKG